MGWRSLMISRPARLSRERHALRIEQQEIVCLPFEDIAVIVLDHPEIVLTHPVLSACGEYGIALFSTDARHLPNAVHTPFLPHTRTVRCLRAQLGLKKPLRKQLWAAIIRAKIGNQARCLQLMGDEEGAHRLQGMAARVKSGDSGMMESEAAAFHFSRLFGKGFRRSQPVWINAALNYGYAVFRGVIARGLVAHGLFPPLGIHHHSEQNAFNLADDLIEPFRPLVDLRVASGKTGEERALSRADKAGLVGLLNVDMRMPQGMMNALNAMEQAVESLVRAIGAQEAERLTMPVLEGLNAHVREC